MSVTQLDDIPKKTQYIILESGFVNGTNNNFALDLTLESNTHVEDMSRVLGIKMCDFYITQIGENDATGSNNIAKYVDIVCPEVPKVAQLLDERHGQVLARVPLERHFSGSSGLVLRDKQWRSFNRKTNYFNPISIKKLNFKISMMMCMATMMMMWGMVIMMHLIRVIHVILVIMRFTIIIQINPS